MEENQLNLDPSLTKQVIGFNTDIIRPGAVFYLHMINNLSDSSHPHDRDHVGFVDGNIMIINSNFSGFEFIRYIDAYEGKMIRVDLADIQSGLITIKEMRELK